MDNLIKFQALKRFFCHAVPIPCKKDLGDDPCGRCVAVFMKMLTHRNAIQNIIIFFIAITGLVSSLIRYEMFELLKEAEINNAVTTIIWLCVLYSSITCIYLYCNTFLGNYKTLRYVWQKEIGCLSLLLSGVYGIFAVVAVYQLGHDMFEWHSKVKDIGFPVLYLYYILWISRLIQRVLACIFFVLVHPVTSSWITYTSLETKEHVIQLVPWQIFHYIQRILLWLTLIWTNQEGAAFEEIAFFLFVQFFMLIRVLWLGLLSFQIMNVSIFPLLHHPEEDQKKLSNDLIGVVGYSPLEKAELVVGVTNEMTYYPEKSEIVIGTIGQRFFDVIKPLEKNKKPEEKITQNHLKDQPLEVPNTTTGPQVNPLDQNETKVYKPPPDSFIPSEQQETLTDPDLTERVIEDVKSPVTSIFHKELDQMDVKESTVDNKKEEINKIIVEGSKEVDVSSKEDDTETTDEYETTTRSNFQNGGTENKDDTSDVQQGSVLRKRHPQTLTKDDQILQLDNGERPGAIRSNSNDEYMEGSIGSSPSSGSVTSAEENISKRPLRTSTHE